MNANPNRAREIFVAALKMAPDEWEGYLSDACRDDQELRSRVQCLLDAHREGDSFLEPAAPGLSAVARESAAERPGTVIGPYKLLEQIGEGGFGVVFMAEQQHPVRRKVALKVLKPGMDTRQVVARFEAERQALALMDHPNIAKLPDASYTSAPRGGRPPADREGLVGQVRLVVVVEEEAPVRGLQLGPRRRSRRHDRDLFPDRRGARQCELETAGDARLRTRRQLRRPGADRRGPTDARLDRERAGGRHVPA